MREIDGIPQSISDSKRLEEIKIEKLESMLLDAVESLIVSCQLLECSGNVLDKHHAKQNLERWTPIWKELRQL